MLICLIVVGVLSIVGLLVVPPLMFRSRKGNPLFFTTLNAAQIGRALSEFKEDYGRYPEGETALEVKQRTGSTLMLSDKTSNGLFAQLLVSGICQNEVIFHAAAARTRMPDGRFGTETEILGSGECGFAYVVHMGSEPDPDAPIAFGPVNPGEMAIDGSRCKGMAVILWIDGTVAALPVDSAGGIVYLGRNLLDPLQPFWKGKVPDVRWPK